MHIGNKGNDILILGEGLTQGLDYMRLTGKAKYPINITQSRKRFALSLHYNGSNSFLFVDVIYQIKAKDSEIKDYALCLCNILNNLILSNMAKTGLKGVVKHFSIDFNPIDSNDILNIHKNLMKRTWHKIMFGLIKKNY